MSYVTTTDQTFGGIDFPIGSPITFDDVNDPRGWNMLVSVGNIVPVAPLSMRVAPTVRAPVDVATLVDAGNIPLQAPGELCEAYATRMVEYMNQQRSRQPSKSWAPYDGTKDLKMALDASEAFERRKAREAQATRDAQPKGQSQFHDGALGFSRNHPEAAPFKVDPSRPWIRP